MFKPCSNWMHICEIGYARGLSMVWSCHGRILYSERYDHIHKFIVRMLEKKENIHGNMLRYALEYMESKK